MVLRCISIVNQVKIGQKEGPKRGSLHSKCMENGQKMDFKKYDTPIHSTYPIGGPPVSEVVPFPEIMTYDTWGIFHSKCMGNGFGGVLDVARIVQKWPKSLDQILLVAWTLLAGRMDTFARFYRSILLDS